MSMSTPSTPTDTAEVGVDPRALRCLASLVASLADNKAALGQRYGEWAVSAPTLESAVAAAAMAQDELGHARATYPVLKQLGVSSSDEQAGGDRRLALLDAELADWTAFVAANLLVDGMLTTFVAACRDSSLEQLAQRARKILQEERSHRLHAEAWARRLCRRGDAERDGLVARLMQAWEQTSRWPGPGDDPGYRAAINAGLIAHGPDHLRRQMTTWLSELLAAEQTAIELTDPADWSGWDAERRR
jgi:ring-1,2-phenylacetyl-CoA epoxidase subunit PaaC